MLDWLLRRGNPTNKWSRSTDLNLTVELRQPSINKVPAGSSIADLAFLGRSASNEVSPLDYNDLGISIDFEEDGSFSGFQVILDDPSQNFESYDGKLTFDGIEIDATVVQEHLGEPFWVDREDDETILFFEYSKHEIQVEQSPEGRNKCLVITLQPLMADPGNRNDYGVDKPWPPKMTT